METKIFGDKKIKIRKLGKSDLRRIEKFQGYINSLINEDVQIMVNKKVSLKKEKEWLKSELKEARNQQRVFLVAEENNKIIGLADVHLCKYRQSHVGEFGISIRKGYRGIGLGTYLTTEIIKLAKKELEPKLKFIRLNVFVTNKPALNLYKKLGFKKVARIPKQIQYQGKLVDEIIMLLKL